MDSRIINKETFMAIQKLDDELSKRFINLDPNGYFLIKINSLEKEIILEHYGNDIDDLGRAIDKETGEVLGCKNESKRTPNNIYKGRSAKEVGIQISEQDGSSLISRIDHALYIGRELQKAEACLLNGKTYVQD